MYLEVLCLGGAIFDMTANTTCFFCGLVFSLSGFGSKWVNLL